MALKVASFWRQAPGTTGAERHTVRTNANGPGVQPGAAAHLGIH